MSTTQTPNPAILTEHVYASGAVGITRDQTARWNVVNPKLPPSMPETGYSVTLRLFSARGDVLGMRSVSLKPGESGSLEWKGSEIIQGNTSAVVHGCAVAVTTGPVDDPTIASNSLLLPTLEVVDKNGQTSILVEGMRVRPSMESQRDNPKTR